MKDQFQDRMLLLRMCYGSQLYGTQTPDSDTDIKGIFLPSKTDILCGRIPQNIVVSKGKDNTKNTKKDKDEDYYSLHAFLKLALEGQTVALDMLHSSPKHWTSSSAIWQSLWENRGWFYSKSITAFIGYARKQAAKYGIKGSRLDAAKTAADFLSQFGEKKVKDVWDRLWTNDYAHKTFNGTHYIWKVCGKGVSETSSCRMGADMLYNYLEKYGARAKLARENKGIDWKAVSHALRAGYEAMYILRHGSFTFPLPETEFLREVKLGKMDYMTQVAPVLEELMDRLEAAAKVSDLPAKPDYVAVEKWLCTVLEEEYFKG